jgi:hypothetical protein
VPRFLSNTSALRDFTRPFAVSGEGHHPDRGWVVGWIYQIDSYPSRDQHLTALCDGHVRRFRWHEGEQLGVGRARDAEGVVRARAGEPRDMIADGTSITAALLTVLECWSLPL